LSSCSGFRVHAPQMRSCVRERSRKRAVSLIVLPTRQGHLRLRAAPPGASPSCSVCALESRPRDV
jgi:hypothetical protein